MLGKHLIEQNVNLKWSGFDEFSINDSQLRFRFFIDSIKLAIHST